MRLSVFFALIVCLFGAVFAADDDISFAMIQLPAEGQTRYSLTGIFNRTSDINQIEIALVKSTFTDCENVNYHTVDLNKDGEDYKFSVDLEPAELTNNDLNQGTVGFCLGTGAAQHKKSEFTIGIQFGSLTGIDATYPIVQNGELKFTVLPTGNYKVALRRTNPTANCPACDSADYFEATRNGTTLTLQGWNRWLGPVTYGVCVCKDGTPLPEVTPPWDNSGMTQIYEPDTRDLLETDLDTVQLIFNSDKKPADFNSPTLTPLVQVVPSGEVCPHNAFVAPKAANDEFWEIDVTGRTPNIYKICFKFCDECESLVAENVAITPGGSFTFVAPRTIRFVPHQDHPVTTTNEHPFKAGLVFSDEVCPDHDNARLVTSNDTQGSPSFAFMGAFENRFYDVCFYWWNVNSDGNDTPAYDVLRGPVEISGLDELTPTVQFDRLVVGGPVLTIALDDPLVHQQDIVVGLTTGLDCDLNSISYVSADIEEGGSWSATNLPVPVGKDVHVCWKADTNEGKGHLIPSVAYDTTTSLEFIESGPSLKGEFFGTHPLLVSIPAECSFVATGGKTFEETLSSPPVLVNLMLNEAELDLRVRCSEKTKRPIYRFSYAGFPMEMPFDDETQHSVEDYLLKKDILVIGNPHSGKSHGGGKLLFVLFLLIAISVIFYLHAEGKINLPFLRSAGTRRAPRGLDEQLPMHEEIPDGEVVLGDEEDGPGGYNAVEVDTPAENVAAGEHEEEKKDDGKNDEDELNDFLNV